MYASNIPSGATSTHNGYDSFRPYAFPSEEEEYVVAAVRSDLPEGISVLSEYQHVYTDIEHSQPVVLGVSMQYHLDERWSVTSGLTYTMLSSRLRSGTDNHYYNSRQTLHYVGGIPLNVNYTVWENDKISTYVSGGGMVEKKCIRHTVNEFCDRQQTSDAKPAGNLGQTIAMVCKFGNWHPIPVNK